MQRVELPRRPCGSKKGQYPTCAQCIQNSVTYISSAHLSIYDAVRSATLANMRKFPCGRSYYTYLLKGTRDHMRLSIPKPVTTNSPKYEDYEIDVKEAFEELVRR